MENLAPMTGNALVAIVFMVIVDQLQPIVEIIIVILVKLVLIAHGIVELVPLEEVAVVVVHHMLVGQ